MNQPTSQVLIAGGGVAALETLLALRDLAGDRVAVTLLAPETAFSYRPMKVAEPFAAGHATEYELAAIAKDLGATLEQDTLAEVRAEEREVVCASGRTLPYDHLVLATGAKAGPAFPTAITFGDDPAAERLHGMLADLEGGYAHRVAFVVPGETTWTLPLYELALMTARQAWSMGMDDLQFTLITPEDRPLAIFGGTAGAAVEGLLAAHGIEFVGSSYATVGRGHVIADPGGRRFDVERVVALPALTGPAIEGVPGDADGFIPVDDHGRVSGLDRVYAAGDGTAFPIKQGGLATQQADAVAEAIAAELGAVEEPEPFRPVLRGILLTGGDDRYLRNRVAGGGGEGEATEYTLWWPPTKIAGRYLSGYLFGRDEARAVERLRGEHLEVDLAVSEPVLHRSGSARGS